jgi:acyl carrier protein
VIVACCYATGVSRGTAFDTDAMPDLLDVIRQVLLRAGRDGVDVGPESSLIEDLGIDSVMFVDLTIGIETRFGIAEFPMQAWVDGEAHVGAERLTVESLARKVSEVSRAAGR